MAADTLVPRFRVLGGSGGGGGGGGGSTSAVARLARFRDGWAGAAAVGLVSAEATFRLRVEAAGGAGGTTSAEGVEAARLSLAEERVTLGDMRNWIEDWTLRKVEKRYQHGSLRSKKQGRG
jgi:hypothetical protein